MNRNPSFLSPPKIDTLKGTSLLEIPGLDQSIWLGAIFLSKIRTLPREGANKIVTELGGDVKKKLVKY